MSVRYVLAPEAALDLVEVWHYIRGQTNTAIADHVESVIRDRIGFLAQAPGAGHMRQDLTNEDVKFFPGLLVPDRISSQDQTSPDRMHSARSPGRGTSPQRSVVNSAIKQV